MFQKNQKAFSKQILHIFFVALFCGGFFFAGQFLYFFLEPSDVSPRSAESEIQYKPVIRVVSSDPAMPLGPQDVVVIPDNLPERVELYVTEINFDEQKKIYNWNETLSGTLTVYYPGQAPVSDIRVMASIGTELNTSGFPGQKIGQKELAVLDFVSSEKKIIPFSFDLPDISLELFNVSVDFLTVSHSSVGFYNGSDVFSLIGSKNLITIKDAFIVADTGKTYFITQWPGVGLGTPNTKLNLTLKLNTPINSLPVRLDIYEENLGGQLIDSLLFSLEKKEDNFSYEIPNSLSPGVYVGQIVASSDDFELLPIHFRWIVGGLQARINTMTFDTEELSLSIVGIPHPETYGAERTTSPEETQWHIQIVFRGKQIFTTSVDLLGYNAVLRLPKKDISSLWMWGVLTARILGQDGKILATSDVLVPINILFMLSMSFGILIALFGAFYFFRHRKTLLILIVCLLLFSYWNTRVEALAWPYGHVYYDNGNCVGEWYSYPSMSLSAPYAGEYAACNEYMQVAGTMTHEACANTGYWVFTTWYRFIGPGGAATSWAGLSPGYTAGTPGDGHSWNAIDYVLNESIGVPSNVSDFNAIQFYVAHNVGTWWCSGTVYYHQPISGVCCSGALPQNAVKCPNTEANTNNQPVLSCTGARACEYDCIGWYIPDSPNSIDCRLPICLANGGIGANTNNVGPANSYVLSGNELPASLTLTQDYYMTLRWSIGATQYTVAEIDRTSTGAGCEYTCNAGYIPDGASSCRLPICLPNSAIGVAANNAYPANASPISAVELPSSLTLVRDYTSTIISDPNRRTELNTAAGCEYSCNDGFKIWPKTATAESNSAGTFAKITHGGGGYTTAPSVQVAGGFCTTRPTAVATINASGSVDSLTLTGAVNCTVAPTLTISAPTDTVTRCIATQCIGFAKPNNATYCSGDTTLAWHDDEMNTRRADSSGCTSNAKCEWYCPAATPFYCESANTCVTSANECGQTNTCKTSAPSELKTETDYPLIQCDAINATSTHFRYKIEKTGGTASDTYISPLFTVWTSVKHPTTFYAGTYKVTCLYGTAANTNASLTDYGMTPDTTCNKTMTVNSTANGCNRIYPYRGSTLSDEMSSASAFDASFRCGSRQPAANTTDTRAYRLQIGTGDPAFLAYDRTITDLFAGLAIGPVSTQTQNYNFSSGSDVSCAAKVGDGYSTNASCQLRTCVGGACANPQTFIVVPSEEITCTNKDSITYDVGCNPSSPDYTQCLQWIYAGTPTSGNTYTRNAKIKVNNIEQDIYFQCKIETPDGALGPVKTCTMQLPTGGMPVTIFAGDATTNNNSTNYSFQTTAYTLKKDTGKPTGSIAYYTNYSNGVTLSQDQYDYWQKQPITAVITCTDKAATSATGEPTQPGETDGSGCACAQTLTNLTDTPPTAPEQAEIDQWSYGLPSTNTNIWPDVMTYSRVINNNKGALISLKVQDTAGNKSTSPLTANFGIDSIEPKLTATKSGSTITLAFTDNHTGASGFWKPLSAFGDVLPSGVSRGTTAANSAILYRIWPKNSLSTLEFGPECSPLPVKNTNYYKYSETASAPTTQTLTLNSFDVNNNIVAYCVQDNAGNINRGYYPNNLTGCFSSSAMPTIPTLSPSTLASHYAPLLKTRLTSSTLSNNEKYGYSFSENPTNASCFRGILSTNITTLVTNQLNPRPAGELTLDNWSTKLSTIKNTTTANTNGYYYYDLGTTTNNTLTITAPTGTGTKSVIVEGGNIQINSNIEYTGTGKTLLLIARKNNAGQGGNIYINPSVTRVDAIIIADGGSLMNGTTTNGTTTTKNWITNATDLTNRLTINGRVYSYNTRGGSITPQATPGTDFDPITTNIGKYFDTASTSTPLITTATPTQAATYDLERLRVMLSDGNSQCTTHVNYQAFTTSTLPALLMRPMSYEGGNCSF